MSKRLCCPRRAMIMQPAQWRPSPKHCLEHRNRVHEQRCDNFKIARWCGTDVLTAVLTPLWTHGLPQGCSTQTAWHSRDDGTPHTRPRASRRCLAAVHARWGRPRSLGHVRGWPRTWTDRSTASLWSEGHPHVQWQFAEREVMQETCWRIHVITNLKAVIFKKFLLNNDAFMSWHFWTHCTCGVPRRSINGTICSAVYLASKRFILASRRSPSTQWGKEKCNKSDWWYYVFLIVNKSHQKTTTNKQLIILTVNICRSIASS